MNRLRTPRRSFTLASLALLVAPLGCGSDTRVTTETPAPAMPVVVTGTLEGAAPAPMPGVPAEPPTIDQAVRQTAGELKDVTHTYSADAKIEVREAEGDAKKAVNDIEDEAKRKARELEADARKSAEEALDKLLPSPK